MRTLLACAVVLCFAITVAADDKNFTSDDGKYAIDFPAKTKFRTGSLKDASLTAYFVEGVANGSEYKVMYFDIPETARNVETKKLFDGGENGEVKKMKAKLVSSKDLKWGPDKHPARDFTLEVGNKTHRYRMIRADLRFYIVIAGGTKEFVTGDDAVKFFDSFEITK